MIAKVKFEVCHEGVIVARVVANDAKYLQVFSEATISLGVCTYLVLNSK